MSSNQSTAANRFRKNLEDAVVFVAAVGLSVLAILELGVLGLGAGTVMLSAAAALVVGREEGVAAATTEKPLATDGGRNE